jgi:hypothetical protein
LEDVEKEVAEEAGEWIRLKEDKDGVHFGGMVSW